MKHPLLLLAFLISATMLFAQNDTSPEVEKQIDEQVWKPFQKSYAAYDTEKFNSLHTDDVLRISEWGIRQGDAYKNSIAKSNARENKPEKTIEFKFEHRVHSDHIAYEVGYYKVVHKNPGKEDKNYFGRFHVVLRKVDGVWKIAQDWDEDVINGAPITAEDFERVSVEPK